MIENHTMLSGRYEIVEQIGTGGMSDVYRAKDHSLGRDVAIKILKEEFAQDVSFVSKFRAEAQAAAGLEHPNIVNIYDVGSQDGMYFIVMEYVEGITLKTYVAKKGQLGYNELLSIMIQVGRGIEAAHNKNIIHRDIKPQNIIISKEGKVKVTDFGIAKAVTSNTINADRMGSVHYVSPEQARNDNVTFQSDIYSLGIVMYEACTGVVPFDGDTAVAVAIGHLQTEITPPSAYVADVPISVEKIILKSTMKKPERRYATIGDMLIDMKKALANPFEDFVIIPPPEDVATMNAIKEEVEKMINPETESKERRTPKTISKAKNRRRIEEPDDDEYDDDDDDESEVSKRMDKAITIMGIAAAVIIVIIVLYLVGSFFGLFRFSFFDRGEKVEQGTMEEVPSVIGKTESEARKIIEDAGFEFELAGSASSDEYGEGQVMAQSPEAGKEAESGSKIMVTLSSGAGEIDIPKVVGLDEQQAISMLETENFTYKKRYEQNSTVPQGKVISQTPEAGNKGKAGDTITLIISSGVGTVRVPNVVGKAEAQARSEIEGAGLVVGSVTTEHSNSVQKGLVIRQGVSGGSVVDSGSTITLVISDGAEIVYYKLTAKEIYPIDGNPTYVVLVDAEGRSIWSETISSGKAVNASNLTSPSGTIIYYDANDHSIELRREPVTFDKQ